MGYISLEPLTIEILVCNHPKVKRIYAYGGMSQIPNEGVQRFLYLKLDDDSIQTFEDDGGGKAIEDAENFLAKLK